MVADLVLFLGVFIQRVYLYWNFLHPKILRK